MSSDIFFFFNGNIITGDKDFSVCTAFAILEDKILYTGTREQVNKHILANYPKLNIVFRDLMGITVVPGFIDSHMHPIIAIYYKTQLQLSHIRSYKELKDEFEEAILNKPKDEWTLGLDFLEERFTNLEERKFPTRYDLDKISSTHPIIVLRHDGHSCVTNSFGLKLLGISKKTISKFEMESGRIEIDETGEPTGVFTESATSILLDQIPTPRFENFVEAGRHFSDEMASHGITTIGGVLQTTEEGPSGSLGSFEFSIMQMLIRENALSQDYVLYLISKKPKKLVRFDKVIKKLDNDRNRFVLGGIKRFLDGAIGARTAFMSEPFSDGDPDNFGYLVHDIEELKNIIDNTVDLGFQVICHAIGDQANRILVDIYEEIQNRHDSSEIKNGFRIEHASVLSDALIEKIRKNEIIIASQPSFLENEYTWLKTRLGEERVKKTYPFKSIIDSGIILAGASDAPVENPSVLNAIGIAMDRFSFIKEECLSINQALKMFTISAAKALRQESLKGSLEPGKYADFIMLNGNILELSADEIKKIKILEAYSRGKCIFR